MINQQQKSINKNYDIQIPSTDIIGVRIFKLNTKNTFKYLTKNKIRMESKHMSVRQHSEFY